MEEKKHRVSDLMGETMEKIRAMVDANTVIGAPITAGDVTLVPVSRLSFGVGAGGCDFASKEQKPGSENNFGGGGAAGVKIEPVAFLVVRGGTVKLLPVAPPPDGALDRVVDMVPELVDKVTDFVEKQKEKKDTQTF